MITATLIAENMRACHSAVRMPVAYRATVLSDHFPSCYSLVCCRLVAEMGAFAWRSFLFWAQVSQLQTSTEYSHVYACALLLGTVTSRLPGCGRTDACFHWRRGEAVEDLQR
jgi:hypothetical protein